MQPEFKLRFVWLQNCCLKPLGWGRQIHFIWGAKCNYLGMLPGAIILRSLRLHPDGEGNSVWLISSVRPRLGRWKRRCSATSRTVQDCNSGLLIQGFLPHHTASEASIRRVPASTMRSLWEGCHTLLNWRELNAQKKDYGTNCTKKKWN